MLAPSGLKNIFHLVEVWRQVSNFPLMCRYGLFSVGKFVVVNIVRLQPADVENWMYIPACRNVQFVSRAGKLRDNLSGVHSGFKLEAGPAVSGVCTVDSLTIPPSSNSISRRLLFA
jgi:hypothetical protein